VEEAAVELGARVVRSMVGKTFVEISKEGADFATEPSKIVDPSWGLWEDGMYAAVRVCDAVSRDLSLLDVIRSSAKWHYTQVNLPYAVEVSRLAERVEMDFGRFRILEVRRLDGVKIVFRDGSWIMFRASGTEPKTRIYCESTDPVRVDELLEVGKKAVEETSLIHGVAIKRAS
jgi:phosphomannomutase